VRERGDLQLQEAELVMHDRHRDARGQALVEFSLVMIVFLPLLMGFIGLG